jgi:hypothetical protein
LLSPYLSKKFFLLVACAAVLSASYMSKTVVIVLIDLRESMK